MDEVTEVSCPACGETTPLTIDLDAGSRRYVAHCEICEQPLHVQVAVSDDGDAYSIEVEEAGEDGDDDESGVEALLETVEVACPACWESIELTLDLSAGSQTYAEDCPVCCRPMSVRVWVSDDLAEHTVEVEAESG